MRIQRGKRTAAVLLIVAAMMAGVVIALGGAMDVYPKYVAPVAGGLIGIGLAMGLWWLRERHPEQANGAAVERE